MQVVLKLQHADPPSSASSMVPTLGSLWGGQEEKKGGGSGEEEAEKGGILGVSSLGAFKKKTSKYPSCFQLLRLPPPAEPVSL